MVGGVTSSKLGGVVLCCVVLFPCPCSFRKCVNLLINVLNYELASLVSSHNFTFVIYVAFVMLARVVIVLFPTSEVK